MQNHFMIMLWSGNFTKLGMGSPVEKVEDIMKIMEYNVLTTPVLMIGWRNDKVKGRVADINEIKELLK